MTEVGTSTLRVTARYAAAAGAAIGVAAAALALVYADAEGRLAVAVSAVLAFSVQVPAFALLRSMRGPAFMTAWTVGALGRVLVLVVFGVIVLQSGALPLEPALISLALYFVICTIIEPLLLER
jgi:hypothetical protein